MAMTKEEIRLHCVLTVMKHGSELDRRNPFDKAREVVDWVFGKDKADKPKSPAEKKTADNAKAPAKKKRD